MAAPSHWQSGTEAFNLDLPQKRPTFTQWQPLYFPAFDMPVASDSLLLRLSLLNKLGHHDFMCTRMDQVTSVQTRLPERTTSDVDSQVLVLHGRPKIRCQSALLTRDQRQPVQDVQHTPTRTCSTKSLMESLYLYQARLEHGSGADRSPQPPIGWSKSADVQTLKSTQPESISSVATQRIADTTHNVRVTGGKARIRDKNCHADRHFSAIADLLRYDLGQDAVVRSIKSPSTIAPTSLMYHRASLELHLPCPCLQHAQTDVLMTMTWLKNRRQELNDSTTSFQVTKTSEPLDETRSQQHD